MNERNRTRSLRTYRIALLALALVIGALGASTLTARASSATALRPTYTQTCPAGYSPGGGTVLNVTYTFTCFTTHPVTATVNGRGWEYTCVNMVNTVIYAHQYFGFAAVTVSDSSLSGTGAVWLYNARTGSYLASTPTYPVGGSYGPSAGSGATNTVYSADGIMLRLGFRQTGGNYVQTGLYGPSDPL